MPDHQRFVAHIDILGMRSLVARDASLAWQLLSKLVEARNKAHDIELTFVESAETVAMPEQVRAVTFSDTIVLFSKGETVTDLKSILVVTTQLLSKALNLCVPIRAGVAVGTFFFNLSESMYAGPALIEAYDLGEAAQWIGITASEEVFRRSKEAGFQSGASDVLIRAKIPVHGGAQDGYAVNWPVILSTSIAAKLPLSGRQVYEGFAQYFGPFEALPERVRVKYEHTASFINQRET